MFWLKVYLESQWPVLMGYFNGLWSASGFSGQWFWILSYLAVQVLIKLSKSRR